MRTRTAQDRRNPLGGAPAADIEVDEGFATRLIAAPLPAFAAFAALAALAALDAG